MRGSTAAFMAAALLMLLVSPALLMLLLSPATSDTFEQETRRMFVQWKAKYKITYEYAGEEECRYALYKNARRIVARSKGVTTTTLNGLGAHASEEVLHGEGVQIGEEGIVRGGDPPDVRGMEGQVQEDLQRRRRGGVPVHVVQGQSPHRRQAQRRRRRENSLRPQPVRRPHQRGGPRILRWGDGGLLVHYFGA